MPKTSVSLPQTFFFETWTNQPRTAPSPSAVNGNPSWLHSHLFTPLICLNVFLFEQEADIDITRENEGDMNLLPNKRDLWASWNYSTFIFFKVNGRHDPIIIVSYAFHKPLKAFHNKLTVQARHHYRTFCNNPLGINVEWAFHHH